MHKGILAGRRLDARRRIVAAAETAVRENGLPPSLLDNLHAAQVQKQDDVRALYELEAIGPIVEMLGATAEAAGMLDQETILAIPGLTKTSREAISAYFEEQHAGSD